MSSIDSVNRTAFFPNSKEGKIEKAKKNMRGQMISERNDSLKANLLKNKSKDGAKVDIHDGIKDFARIKKAVDNGPEIDNSAKIAALKDKIGNGSYQIDYDALADRILSEQF